MGKIRKEQIDLSSLEIDVWKKEPDPEDVTEGALYLADGVDWDPVGLPWGEPYYVVWRDDQWRLWGGGSDMRLRYPDTPFPSHTGEWEPGLMEWTEETLIRNALYDMNKAFYYMAPERPESLDGKNLNDEGINLMDGRLSAGNENYKPGDEAGSTVGYITTDPNFMLHSPDQETTFDTAELGLVTAYINEEKVDEFDLGEHFDPFEEDGAQSYPPAWGEEEIIEVTDVAWYNDFPLWQKGNATLHIDDSLVRIGWNNIRMTREGGPLDQNTQDFDIFYDQGIEGASINTPAVEEESPEIKYLSGVQFYDTGSTFRLSCVAENVFNNTYHEHSPVRYTSTSSALGSGNIDYDDTSVSGVSDPPHINETMTVTDKVIAVPSGQRSMNARVTATARKPWSSSNQVSASENRLVDSVSASSNDMNEYFNDEDYRLNPGEFDSVPGDITGQWDSQAFLEDGNAQVYDGALRYPQTDFSSGYLPEQEADYSGFSGPQVYYRAIHVGEARSSGTLRLGNLSDSDVQPAGSGNVNVELKLPGETGWLDLGQPYDDGTFSGADGDGCRTGSVSGSDWSWTCGTFSTVHSGNMYIVKVTLNSSNTYITEIRELD